MNRKDFLRAGLVMIGGVWVPRPQAATILIGGPRVPSVAAPTYYYAVGWDVNASGGSAENIIDADFAILSKVTISSTGTATKLGIYISTVNASTDVKMALFDSSRALVGSGVSTTIASGDAQWHDITSSVTVSSTGTYYIGISVDGPYTGSLVTTKKTGTSGDAYLTFDASTYTNFPGSITGLSAGDTNFASRVEITA